MFKWGSMIKYISIFIFTANSLFSTDLSMSALIRLDQGFIDYRVFSNYGNIKKGLGMLNEAKELYEKAIKAK